MSGIWEGIISNAVWWILMIAVAALLGWMRAKIPNYAAVAWYGLAAATCVAILGFTFTGHSLLSAPPTNGDNVEANIKSWAASLGLGLESTGMPENTWYFGYAISERSELTILIGRKKDRPQYLQFEVKLQLSQRQMDELAKFSPADLRRFSDELTLELARSKMQFSYAGEAKPGAPPLIVSVGKSVPIADLTDTSFASSIDEVSSAAAMTRCATSLILDRLSDFKAMPRLVAP